MCISEHVYHDENCCTLDGDVGITPAITNEVGLYVTPDSYDLMELPRNTRVNAHRVKVIKDRRNRADSASIAVPNDRSCSVRPGDTNLQYEFVFYSLFNVCSSVLLGAAAITGAT